MTETREMAVSLTTWHTEAYTLDMHNWRIVSTHPDLPPEHPAVRDGVMTWTFTGNPPAVYVEVGRVHESLGCQPASVTPRLPHNLTRTAALATTPEPPQPPPPTTRHAQPVSFAERSAPHGDDDDD